jgi:cytochrome c
MVRLQVILLCLLANSVVSTAASAEGGEAQRGYKIAHDNCAPCHAIGTTGASPNAAAPAFRSFGQKWPVESLEEALAEGISVGHGPMPEFVFQPEQISDLVAYLRTIQGTHQLR